MTLGDVPCAKGSQEQVRAMQRPKDGTPLPAAAPVPVAQAQVAPPQVVTVRTPQPMYECITPDGERYTSETGDGNPRWVPLWTLGYPAVRPHSVLGGNIGHPDRVLHPPHRDVIWPVATGGGTWVRDDCAMLPPREACARLRDRRGELRTRFFNAQEKERDVLREEERALNARLDNDCGGR